MSSTCRECNCNNEKAFKAYFPGNEPPAFVCKRCAADVELMYGAEKIIPLKTGIYKDFQNTEVLV